MQDRQEKKIQGVNVLKERREYVFYMMDTDTGGELFHRFFEIVVDSYATLKGLYNKKMAGEKILDPESENLIAILQYLPKVFTWEVVKEIQSKMLANHKVKINGEIFTADENGVCHETMQGDPLEVYTAILYATLVNYEKHIDPLLAWLGEIDSEDTSQSKEPETQEK